MNIKISQSEYEYLESRTKLGLTIEEYEVIKHALVAEQIFHDLDVDMNNVDINLRIIAIVCSAFGFYIDQTGELSFQ